MTINQALQKYSATSKLKEEIRTYLLTIILNINGPNFLNVSNKNSFKQDSIAFCE